jgi:hypothetical protein
MSEYHVVRQGVDEEALKTLLRQRYAETTMMEYWSTQAGPLQRLGQRLGLHGTFSLVARDRLGDASPIGIAEQALQNGQAIGADSISHPRE